MTDADTTPSPAGDALHRDDWRSAIVVRQRAALLVELSKARKHRAHQVAADSRRLVDHARVTRVSPADVARAPEPPPPSPQQAAASTNARLAAVVDRERQLAEFMDDAYLVTNCAGGVQWANGVALHLLGVPAWAMAHRPFVFCIRPDQRERFRLEMRQLVRHGSRVDGWHLVLVQESGDEAEVVASVAPLHDAGGVLLGHRWVLRAVADLAVRSVSEAPFAAADPLAIPAGQTRDRRLALIAQLAALLSTSIETSAPLAAATQLLVPMLGDWAILDLAPAETDDTALRRLHVSFAHRGNGPAARVLYEHPPRLDDTGCPIAESIRDGEARIFRPVDDEFLRRLTCGHRAGLGVLRDVAPKSCMIVPLVARGHVHGAFTFLSTTRAHYPADLDVGRQVAAQAALAEDNRRLYLIAEQANQAKSEFLATVSHELRTPLTAIMGYTELLADGLVGPVTETQRHHLGRVLASSVHLLSLVEQILGFSRAEAGHELPRLAPADGAEIARAAVELVEPLARAAGLDLRVEIPAEPIAMYTDAGKVRQVLVNLLANAIKFTDAGEVGLRVASADGWATLEVWDTGIGIAPDDLKRVFDPFWQVEQRATRRHGGTGLGLSLVRQFTRLLDGEVTATSEVGVGSRFVVRLPERSLAPQAPPVPATREEPHSETIAGTPTTS